MRFVLLLFAFALVASAKGEEFFLVPTMPPDTSTAVVVEQSAITTSVPAQFAAYGSSGGMMTASARWQFPVTARRVCCPTHPCRPTDSACSQDTAAAVAATDHRRPSAWWLWLVSTRFFNGSNRHGNAILDVCRLSGGVSRLRRLRE
ncbi:MAG: hypothetical protein R3E01_10330 [Pirellulaceae bacterium]